MGALRQRAAEAFVVAPDVTQRQLTGHSGARVVLHAASRDSFVRKTVANSAMNDRLRGQADKQHSLWMLGLPFPKVRSQALDAAGRGSFDMNYIPGRTIADAVLNGGRFEPGMVLNAIARMTSLFTLQAGPPLAESIFAAKIHEIKKRSAAITDNADLDRMIDACATRLLMRDWAGIPQSPCHGDLTLENILLTAGKSIAFIDCDVPFASSYWLDFGKLFQDIDGHWCIRTLYMEAGNAIRLLNATQKLAALGADLRAMASTFHPQLAESLPQLAALGLFRALPYCADDAVREFICRHTLSLLER